MKKRNKCGKIGNPNKTFKRAKHKINPAGTKLAREAAAFACTLKARKLNV